MIRFCRKKKYEIEDCIIENSTRNNSKLRHNTQAYYIIRVLVPLLAPQNHGGARPGFEPTIESFAASTDGLGQAFGVLGNILLQSPNLRKNIKN